MATLTSATAQLAIVIAGLFPDPQQIQGFATDDAWASDPVSSAQTLMGIDGMLSGGYTPAPKMVHITLQADSPSIPVFEFWWTTQESVRETFTADMVATVPGLARVYNMTRGFLTNYSVIPDARRILQPRRFTLTFQSIIPSPQ